jgi:sortase A
MSPGRRPERRRRALRALSSVLIVAGVLVLADAVLTVVWQEPLTAYVSARDQAGLQDEFGRLRAVGPTAAETRALRSIPAGSTRTAYLARSLRQRAAEGSAVARLRIPRIGVDSVVVQGTRPPDLRKGPGIYDRSSFPGSGGTTAIAGHRTTYGAPFRNVDELEPGDRIELELPYGSFGYEVESTRIVDPSEVSVLERVDHEQLVLSACHPLFSAAQRIVVFARLTDAGDRDPRVMGPPHPGEARSNVRRGRSSDVLAQADGSSGWRSTAPR